MDLDPVSMISELSPRSTALRMILVEPEGPAVESFWWYALGFDWLLSDDGDRERHPGIHGAVLPPHLSRHGASTAVTVYLILVFHGGFSLRISRSPSIFPR